MVMVSWCSRCWSKMTVHPADSVLGTPIKKPTDPKRLWVWFDHFGRGERIPDQKFVTAWLLWWILNDFANVSYQNAEINRLLLSYLIVKWWANCLPCPPPSIPSATSSTTYEVLPWHRQTLAQLWTSYARWFKHRRSCSRASLRADCFSWKAVSQNANFSSCTSSDWPYEETLA